MHNNKFQKFYVDLHISGTETRCQILHTTTRKQRIDWSGRWLKLGGPDISGQQGGSQ